MNATTTNLGALRAQMDRQQAEGEWVALVKAIALAQAEGERPAVVAVRQGASDRVSYLLRAGVGGGASVGNNWAEDLVAARGAIVSAFFSSLRSSSAFFALLSSGVIVRTPLRTRIAMVSSGAVGWVIGAGKAAPLSALATESGAGIERKFAASLLVVTRELLAVGNSAALFERELRGAIGAVVDQEFVAAILNDTATLTIPASANVLRDLRESLSAVNTHGQPHRLAWIAGVATANTLATLGDTGSRLFPEMGPQGGTILGLPAFVTTGITSDALALVDGSAIIGDSDDIAVTILTDGDIEMRDNPVGDLLAPTGATNMVSMFQTNSVGIKSDVSFGFEKVRDNAVALISGAGAWDPIPT